MVITHIAIQIKPEFIEAFKQATIVNARESVREPGIARFDFVQETADATRFTLVEVYRTADAPEAHRATAHYAAWRDAVAPMMAAPRERVHFHNVFPADENW